MASASLQPASSRMSAGDPGQRIVDFASGWSLEATRPSDIDIAALKTVLPPAAPVYLSAVPTRDPAEQISDAVRLHAAVFAPVPHIAVRNFALSAALDAFLARMTDEAGVSLRPGSVVHMCACRRQIRRRAACDPWRGAH